MPDEENEIELEDEVIEEEGLKDKLKKMREDLKICRKEKEDYLAGWQRAKADFINAKKDEEKAREVFIKFASASVINDFLKVADSLEMSLKHKVEDGTKEIYSQLKEILKQHGVTPMEVMGTKFNPAEHEALGEMEVDEERDNLIVEELQKGWRLHDKVLRPAKVKVGVLKK